MNIEKNDSDTKKLNNIGLIEGVVGTAFSLLSVDLQDKCFWDQPFLLV